MYKYFVRVLLVSELISAFSSSEELHCPSILAIQLNQIM